MSFLLILTTGIFRLVLSELIQNRANSGYLQAHAGAGAAWELALLQIKKQWYGSYDAIDHSINNRSIVLSENPGDTGLFKKQKDVFISYDLGYRVSQYNWKLEKLGYDIIPLYSDDTPVDQLSLEINSGNGEKVLWNIIASNGGLAGSGPFTNTSIGKEKTLDENNILSFWNIGLGDFLAQSSAIDDNQNYLFIFNGGDIDLEYSLISGNDRAFTAPQTQIISSAQLWNYRQNIQTSLDNTKFLWILRYSVFSPNAWF